MLLVPETVHGTKPPAPGLASETRRQTFHALRAAARADLPSGVDDAPNHIIQQPKNGNLSAFTYFFRALKCFDEMHSQKAVAQPGALPCALHWPGRSQNHATHSADLIELAVD